MIYQYKCNQCNTELEVERGITEPALAPTCIDCHGTMSRIWTAPAIEFRGKGWYSTDK